jgi:cytochrome b561
MQLKNTTTSYGAITKLLHWTVAILVIALLTVGFLMGDISDKTLKMQVYNLHKLLGLGILLLMLSRLIWRLINIQPGYAATIPSWEKRAARAVHDVLYLCLIVMPLSGWIMSTATAHAPHIGSWVLNAPGMVGNQLAGHYAANLHRALAWGIPAFVLLHIVAALKHHFLDKNNVLLRMLPWVKNR